MKGLMGKFIQGTPAMDLVDLFLERIFGIFASKINWQLIYDCINGIASAIEKIIEWIEKICSSEKESGYSKLVGFLVELKRILSEMMESSALETAEFLSDELNTITLPFNAFKNSFMMKLNRHNLGLGLHTTNIEGFTPKLREFNSKIDKIKEILSQMPRLI